METTKNNLEAKKRNAECNNTPSNSLRFFNIWFHIKTYFQLVIDSRNYLLILNKNVQNLQDLQTKLITGAKLFIYKISLFSNIIILTTRNL